MWSSRCAWRTLTRASFNQVAASSVRWTHAPFPRGFSPASSPLPMQAEKPFFVQFSRTLSSSPGSLLPSQGDKPESLEKPSLAKRFKQMFKDYWYVLVPVHIATSVVWYGGFYVMCKSGLDMAAVLQTLGASEAYLEKIRNSDLGYYALAYACYKVATPARYTVTLGGTTLSIKYLTQWGLLKTSSQMASNIKEKSEGLKEKFEEEYEKAWKRFAKKK